MLQTTTGFQELSTVASAVLEVANSSKLAIRKARPAMSPATGGATK